MVLPSLGIRILPLPPGNFKNDLYLVTFPEILIEMTRGSGRRDFASSSPGVVTRSPC